MKTKSQFQVSNKNKSKNVESKPGSKYILSDLVSPNFIEDFVKKVCWQKSACLLKGKKSSCYSLKTFTRKWGVKIIKLFCEVNFEESCCDFS